MAIVLLRSMSTSGELLRESDAQASVVFDFPVWQLNMAMRYLHLHLAELRAGPLSFVRKKYVSGQLDSNRGDIGRNTLSFLAL